MWEGTGEAATGTGMFCTAMEAAGVGHMCETPLEAWSWCTRAAEAAEGAVVTMPPSRSAKRTAYLWAVSEAD